MPKFSSLRRGISHLTALKRQSSSSRSSSRISTDPENSQSMAETSKSGFKKIRSMSYDSLNKLTGCVDNMNEDVGKLLLTSDKDLRKNPDLFNLVNDFFNTNTELSHLCESLKICLEKAHRGETLVHEALSDFMEEKRVSGEEASFRKTLQDLRSFKEYSGHDPFSGDFLRLFRSCHGDLVKMIGKLSRTTKRLDRKLWRIRRRRRVSLTMFLAAVAAVVVGAAVAGLVAAPPVLAAVGAVVSFVPMGSLGLCISSWWQKSQGVLKRQKTAISSMERGTCVALSEVARISVLVNRLEDVMRSMGERAAAAEEKRSPIKTAMGEVEKELLSYKDAIGLLQHEAGRCDEDARLSRDVARENITKYLTPFEKPSTMNTIFSAFVH